MQYYFKKINSEMNINCESNDEKKLIKINDNNWNESLKNGNWTILLKKDNKNKNVGIVLYNALCSNYDNTILFKRNKMDIILESFITIDIDKKNIVSDIEITEKSDCYFYYDKQNKVIAIECT